jgi:hypothetical protein
MTVLQAIVALGRASWQVLRRHPRLCWFPVLSMIAVIGVFVIIGPIIVAPDDDDIPWLALLIVTTIAHLVHVFFDVALTNEALKALRGESPSIGSGVDAAISRAPAIAVFAAVTGPVGFVLAMMGTSSRWAIRVARRLLGTAWSLATFFAVPVMVQERRGGIPSLRRSGELFKRTWGETALSEVGVRVLIAHITIVLIILAVILIHLLGESPFTLLVVLGLVAGTIALVGSLEAIYRAALYVFAAEGVVPEPFGGPELEDIWQVK